MLNISSQAVRCSYFVVDMLETDQLWDELNLGGLVESMKPMYGLADKDSLDRISRSNVLKKHNDIVQKPNYSVLMGRYQALPHKPKTIQSKKLDLLADPIKGRFMRIDKLLQENRNVDQSMSPSKRTIRLANEPPALPVSPARQTKAQSKPGGFFLTGEDDNGDDESEPPMRPVRTKAAGGGMASNLRRRVQDAQSQDINSKYRAAKAILAKNTGNAKGRAVINSNRVAPKKAWHDNTHVSYQGKSKGYRGNKHTELKNNATGIPRVRGEQPAAAVERNRRVPSSGYGYKEPAAVASSQQKPGAAALVRT